MASWVLFLPWRDSDGSGGINLSAVTVSFSLVCVMTSTCFAGMVYPSGCLCRRPFSQPGRGHGAENDYCESGGGLHNKHGT